MAVTKIKLANLAKDLNLKNKDLIDILNAGGFPKGSSASLEPDEFSYLIDQLTRKNQVSGFDDYLNGKTVIIDDRIESAANKAKPESSKAAPEKTSEKTSDKPEKPTETEVKEAKTEVKKSANDENKASEAVKPLPKKPKLPR